MTAPASIIRVGTLEDLPTGPPLFFAFGDRDDPQRLTVLIAEQLAKLSSNGTEIRKKAEVCLDPRASWKRRRIALADALTLAADEHTGHFIALADIDALAPCDTEDFGADRSATMRRDLYDLVLESVERGGWHVFRTCPDRRVSPDLARRDVEVTYAPEPLVAAQPDEVRSFAPDVRPIAAHLVRRGVLRPRDLSRIVADVDDFDAHVVDLAYDALPAVARDAGKLLSTVRPPQHINGSLGPFAYADGPPTTASIPRAAADALRASAFLQPGGGPATLRMPRLVRDMLRRFAPLGMSNEVRRLHVSLAARPIDARSTAEQIEIHHHAVRAGDIDRAKSTARFYGTELRDLATQLSLDGKRDRNRTKYLQAAELFEHIVTSFDATDAYAWEYMGYNLALTEDPTQHDRILDAYERAHALWRANPLYHGRWLGFRGQLGQNVADDIVNWLDRYVDQYGAKEQAVSYFAEAALKGLRRGRQRDQLAQVVRQRRTILERFAPRAIAAVADDE